eukprot:6465340-Amphidinium_carterae.2
MHSNWGLCNYSSAKLQLQHRRFALMMLCATVAVHGQCKHFVFKANIRQYTRSQSETCDPRKLQHSASWQTSCDLGIPRFYYTCEGFYHFQRTIATWQRWQTGSASRFLPCPHLQVSRLHLDTAVMHARVRTASQSSFGC